MLFMWEELMGRCYSHQTIISPSVCLHKAMPRQEQNCREGENKRSLHGELILQLILPTQHSGSPKQSYSLDEES